MLVLIDLEWVDSPGGQKNLTQLSALRVDAAWNITEEFHTLTRPADEKDTDWFHVAYYGYVKERFLEAPEEADCIRAFSRWLSPDDVLCTWHHSGKKALQTFWKKTFGHKPTHGLGQVNSVVYERLKMHDPQTLGLYALAEARGIPLLYPQHCSDNDVRMLAELLMSLPLTQQQLCNGHSFSLADRNRNLLKNIGIQYAYGADAKTFHRPTCHHALRIRNLVGCKHYDTASKNRRPCKVCNPEYILPLAPSAPKKPYKQPAPEDIRLLDGSCVYISPRKIVGCCHNAIHPGKMTRKIMEQHDCLGKQCHYFEKYEESSYWLAQEQKKKDKNKRKEKQRQEQAAQNALAKKLQKFQEDLQSYAHQFGYDMEIIDVTKESDCVYKVLYVSDRPFRDAHLYPKLQPMVYRHYPMHHLALRHIRDEEGNFVTTDEFYHRRQALRKHTG